MDKRIRKLTVVSGGGVDMFAVGSRRNGEIIARIECNSLEYENDIHHLYAGFAENGDFIFEVVNAPVVVEYGP